jgi:hypothetical protein
MWTLKPARGKRTNTCEGPTTTTTTTTLLRRLKSTAATAAAVAAAAAAAAGERQRSPRSSWPRSRSTRSRRGAQTSALCQGPGIRSRERATGPRCSPKGGRRRRERRGAWRGRREGEGPQRRARRTRRRRRAQRQRQRLRQRRAVRLQRRRERKAGPPQTALRTLRGRIRSWGSSAEGAAPSRGRWSTPATHTAPCGAARAGRWQGRRLWR